MAGQQIAVRGSEQAGQIKVWNQYVAAHKNELKQAATESVDIQRLYRMTTSLICTNRDIQQCSIESVFQSMQKAAECGLDPNSPLGECYIVPFNNKVGDRWVKTAQFIIGYRGMVSLARRSGAVTAVEAGVVYQCDEFEYERGLTPKLRHVPKPGPRKPSDIVCFWALARLVGGEAQFDVMTVDEVNAIRERSKAKNGPWTTDYAEMGKKTVVRRMLKLVPMSIRMMNIIERADPDERWSYGSAPAKVEVERPALNADLSSEIEDIDFTADEPLPATPTVPADPDTGEVFDMDFDEDAIADSSATVAAMSR